MNIEGLSKVYYIGSSIHQACLQCPSLSRQLEEMGEESNGDLPTLLLPQWHTGAHHQLLPSCLKPGKVYLAARLHPQLPFWPNQNCCSQ